MANDPLKTTKQWRQLKAFADAYPAYFDYSLACVKAWGESGMQLQHCIAIALKNIHEMGLRGEHPQPLGPVGKAMDAQADSVALFEIDCKPPPKPKMYVTVTAPTVKRVGRSPPPTVKRISRG